MDPHPTSGGKPNVNFLLRLFYLSYFLHCIIQNTWMFSAAFVFLRLGGMRLVATKQLLRSGATMLLSPYVGHLLGRCSRLRGAVGFGVLNNGSIITASVLFAFCYSLDSDTVTYRILLAIAVAQSALTKVGTDGEWIALQNDWLVVMTKEKSDLAARNATMTTVYQSTLLISPVLGGFLLSFYGEQCTCVVFAIATTVIMVPKFLILKTVHANIPELHRKCDKTEKALPKSPSLWTPFRSYWNMSVFAVSFASVSHFICVLKADPLSIAYAKRHGIPEAIIGLFNGASAATGLLGSFTYPYLQKWIGTSRSGFIGMSAYCIVVIPCMASLWLPGGLFSSNKTGQIGAYFYLSGTSLTSFGCWILHLAALQLMQSCLDDSIRTSVFGVKNSLLHMCLVLKNIIIALAPSEEAFEVYILCSGAFLVFLEIVYCRFLTRERNTEKIDTLSGELKA